jgi:peroxiredoxin
MILILFLTCLGLSLLIGECWLLFQLLSQQGRLLLRLEAVEAGQSQADPSPQTENAASGEQEVVPPVPAIGEPAPDFSLPDLSGNLVKLSDYRGRSTLVLFWRPSCAFCQRMLPDLQDWEAHRSENTPHLIIVSCESVADNQALGLHAPIVLDHTVMGVSRRFGARGTPMAMLVDEEGKMASALAAGVPAVLTLARSVQEMLAPV